MARRGRPRHPDILTPREWEVLALLRENLTNEQIAERLGVTIHAARYHVSEILSKLSVPTREEAAAWQPPEPRPVAVWSRALQGAVVLGAIAVVASVVALAFGVFRTSGDDDSVAQTSSATPTASASITDTPFPTESFIPATRPPVGPNVRDMQLVTPGFAWILTDDALISGLTGDRPVQNILPPGVTPTNVHGVFFLDADHGWFAASGRTPSHTSSPTPTPDTTSTDLLVYRTTDGGVSWESNLSVVYPGNPRRVSIDFLDAQHGWIVVDTQTTMNSPTGDLFRTDDGGRTWTPLTVPSGDPVFFTGTQNGWQAASRCSTCPSNDLKATHDGGITWNDVTIDGAAATDTQNRRFGLPVKLAGGSLLLPVTITEGDNRAFALYQSTDNGQTWHESSRLATSQLNDLSYHIFPDGSLVGLSVVSFSPRQSELWTYTPGGDWSGITPVPGLDGGVLAISFIDSQHGWALVTQNGCNALKTDCWQVQYIEQTEDGGQTWSSLPAPEIPAPAS